VLDGLGQGFDVACNWTPQSSLARHSLHLLHAAQILLIGGAAPFDVSLHPSQFSEMSVAPGGSKSPLQIPFKSRLS
jgi:hypothetical protein